jgi:hypothetical protein
VWSRPALLFLVLLAGAAEPSDRLAAQSAGTVPVHDPVYEDLARLDALGLLSRGLADQRPFGAERVRALVEDAVRRLAARRLDLDSRTLEDVDSLLVRIQERFGRTGRGRAEGRAEIGASPSTGSGL